jgi:hypothetical protein
VPYTREKPNTAPSSEELRRTIPGWGVDLNPADRPSVPKEREEETGAHWQFPERQPQHFRREKSTEHEFVTPVFGTAQPLRGLSGQIRRFAYTFSEGQTAHWMLLMVGDRVDVLESRAGRLLTGRFDNPIAQSGVAAEFENQAWRTRFGQHRADLRHQPLDIVLWAAPYAVLAGGLYLLMKGVRGHR